MSWYSRWRDRRTQRKIAKAAGIQTKAISDLVVLIGPDGFFPAVSITSTDTPETLLESATWAYTAITGNADAISSLEGIVQKEGGEGEAAWIRQRDRTHPLARFLRHPLGPGVQPELTWSQVIRIASMQLDICGNSYWRIIDLGRGGQRLALEPLHPSPDRIQAISESGVTPAPTGARIVGYRVTDADRGINQDFPVDEIVHIVEDSPTSLVRGRAPLSVALRPITIDRQAQERQKHFLLNRVGPGLVISLKSPLDYVGDDQAAAVKKNLIDNYQKAEKEGLPLVVSDGTKLSQAPTPSDVQYFETRRMSRDEILAVFRVPPPVAGIFESATLQNFAQARRVWWANALFPRLQSILSAFNRQAIQPRVGEDLRIWYSDEGTDIGLDLIRHKAEVAGVLVNQLGYPTNVAAAYVGLDIERIPELDAPNARFVTAGRVFDAGGAPVGDSPPDAVEATPAPPVGVPDEPVAAAEDS